MKSICFFILFAHSISYAQIDGSRDVIKDTSISLRCKRMLEQRTNKIRIKQKLTEILQRSIKLLQKSHLQQKTVKRQLEMVKTQTSNQLRLTKINIASMEESIVRKGCPGISL